MTVEELLAAAEDRDAASRRFAETAERYRALAAALLAETPSPAPAASATR